MIKHTTKIKCLHGIEFLTLYVEKMISAATKSMVVCRDESHDLVPAPILISTYFKISNHF
jgi:hypothetical protein